MDMEETVMQLWEVLVPSVDNDGKKIEMPKHQVWDEAVYKITGGLTIRKPTKGKWVRHGKIYVERSIPVRIACSKEQIIEILKFTKEHYNQLAVMAYKISNEVIIFE